MVVHTLITNVMHILTALSLAAVVASPLAGAAPTDHASSGAAAAFDLFDLDWVDEVDPYADLVEVSSGGSLVGARGSYAVGQVGTVYRVDE